MRYRLFCRTCKVGRGVVSQKTTVDVADNSTIFKLIHKMTEQRLQVMMFQSDDYPVYDGTADNINNSRTVKSECPKMIVRLRAELDRIRQIL